MNLLSSAAFVTMPTLDIKAPEFGGVVRIRAMAGAEAEGMAADVAQGENESNHAYAARFGRFVLAAFAIDEAGAKLFADPADAPAELPASFATRLVGGFYKLNDFSGGRDAEGN